MSAVRAPWAHYQYGSQHVAWCTSCEVEISGWRQPWNELTLPAAQRRKVDDHLATHVRLAAALSAGAGSRDGSATIPTSSGECA
jgi:hypothetical protein